MLFSVYWSLLSSFFFFLAALLVCCSVPGCISTSQFSLSEAAGGEEEEEKCDSALILGSRLEEIVQAVIAELWLRVNQANCSRTGWDSPSPLHVFSFAASDFLRWHFGCLPSNKAEDELHTHRHTHTHSKISSARGPCHLMLQWILSLSTEFVYSS